MIHLWKKNEISWNFSPSIRTDGAAAMVGHISGSLARIQNKNKIVESIHCCCHRQALAVKRMHENLKLVLNDVVKIVNFIKSRPLNATIFSLLIMRRYGKHS